MGPITCPSCNAIVPDREVAEGWCEACGKKLPPFALSRSSQAGKQPPPAAKSERAERAASEGRWLFVGNLADHITAGAVEPLFAPYGRVQLVQVFEEPGTGRSQGIGRVLMASGPEAEAAAAALNGKEVEGRKIMVFPLRPEWLCPRCGWDMNNRNQWFPIQSAVASCGQCGALAPVPREALVVSWVVAFGRWMFVPCWALVAALGVFLGKALGMGETYFGVVVGFGWLPGLILARQLGLAYGGPVANKLGL